MVKKATEKPCVEAKIKHLLNLLKKLKNPLTDTLRVFDQPTYVFYGGPKEAHKHIYQLAVNNIEKLELSLFLFELLYSTEPFFSPADFQDVMSDFNQVLNSIHNSEMSPVLYCLQLALFINRVIKSNLSLAVDQLDIPARSTARAAVAKQSVIPAALQHLLIQMKQQRFTNKCVQFMQKHIVKTDESMRKDFIYVHAVLLTCEYFWDMQRHCPQQQALDKFINNVISNYHASILAQGSSSCQLYIEQAADNIHYRQFMSCVALLTFEVDNGVLVNQYLDPVIVASQQVCQQFSSETLVDIPLFAEVQMTLETALNLLQENTNKSSQLLMVQNVIDNVTLAVQARLQRSTTDIKIVAADHIKRIYHQSGLITAIFNLLKRISKIYMATQATIRSNVLPDTPETYASVVANLNKSGHSDRLDINIYGLTAVFSVNIKQFFIELGIVTLNESPADLSLEGHLQWLQQKWQGAAAQQQLLPDASSRLFQQVIEAGTVHHIALDQKSVERTLAMINPSL